jgi:hypothetical protein
VLAAAEVLRSGVDLRAPDAPWIDRPRRFTGRQ